MLRVRQKIMNDLRSLRQLAGLSQAETSSRSGVPIGRLGLVEHAKIVLDARAEFIVRRVLLTAIQERVVIMTTLLTGEWGSQARV